MTHLDPPRVLISYSHESDEHRAQVLALSDRLRGDGVDAVIDRYTPAPDVGWPRWIVDQIEQADYVLCVCTHRYRASFEGTHLPGRGLGVNAEGHLITTALYRSGGRNTKFIPVLFSRPYPPTPDWEHVPHVLHPYTRYVLPDGYESLYRHLTGQAPVIPAALGQIGPLVSLSVHPEMPRREAASGGFRTQAEPTTVIKAREPQVEAPPGLYLTRLINPPSRVNAGALTTLWLAAHGPHQIYVDSVRISAFQPSFGGPALVCVPADAAYTFSFAEDSDVTHALEPALSLGPETRRSALVTLRLLPEPGVRDIGSLDVWLHYHTADGRSGALPVLEPPWYTRWLARQTDCVLSFGRSRTYYAPTQVTVTPEGWVRGEPGSGPAMAVESIRVPSDREALLRVLESRAPVHDALSPLVEHLANDTRPEDPHMLAATESLDRSMRRSPVDAFLVELVGELGTEAATTLLLAHGASSGLRVRHRVVRDDLLVDRFDEHGDLETLLRFPVPGWERIKRGRPEIARRILDYGRSMPLDAWAHAVDAEDGPFGVPFFVRGTMNGWGVDLPLRRSGPLKYAVTMEISEGEHELKIGDAEWSHLCDLGPAQPSQLEIGHPMALVRRGHNIRFASDGGTFAIELSFRPGSERVEFELSARKV